MALIIMMGSMQRRARESMCDTKEWGEKKKWGKYSYLYGGTERFDTWVVGYGTTFEGRIAKYRVPAGGAGDQLPPEEG